MYIINAIACLTDADQMLAIEEIFGDSKLTEIIIFGIKNQKRHQTNWYYTEKIDDTEYVFRSLASI